MRVLSRSLLPAGLLLALAVAALYPLVHRQVERRRVGERLARASIGCERAAPSYGAGVDLVARLDRLEPVLAAWQDVGGCGVGGGPGAGGGGVKWIGRKVTGGLVDLECMSSAAFVTDGMASSLNLRLSTELFNKWIIGAGAPFMYKLHEVDVFGEKKTARLPGWGDLAVDATYKLGIDNSSNVTLQLTAPTGSSDAVRQGVVLPQQAQLGSGQFGGSLTFEHTFDKIWGLIILGGNVASPFARRGSKVGENSIGDYRAATGSAYGYLGYLWGPFVPHAGLTFTGRYERDRERREVLAGQSLATGTLHLGIEWASDYLALLLAGNTTWSLDNGAESWTLALGATTSAF